MINTKILVIGYQRSGTTLLRRLLNAHPSVYTMFHETWMLNKDNVRLDPKNGGLGVSEPAGEKIVYLKRNTNAVLEYIATWRSCFHENNRIIHIVRHPLDVALSNMKLKWAKNIDSALQNYFSSLIVMLKTKDTYIIKYEDLVLTPIQELIKLYNFCELSNGFKLINVVLENGFANLEVYGHSPKLNRSRVFAYRSLDKKIKNLTPTGIKAGIGANRILNELPGTMYKWPIHL